MTWTVITPSQTPGWEEMTDMHSRIVQEDSGSIRMEGQGFLLLEGQVSDWSEVVDSQTPGWVEVTT